MKLIKRSAGNYITEDGNYTVWKREWDAMWYLYTGGLMIGIYRTMKQAKEEIERREVGRSAR